MTSIIQQFIDLRPHGGFDLIMADPIPASALPILLELEPETGRLFWRHRPLELFSGERAEREMRRWNGRYAGKQAFTASDTHGYRHGSIFGNLYLAHRVVFAITTGRWPDGQVDHINGNRQDNRPDNLREVELLDNARNQCRPRSNTSGENGICWDSSHNKWLVQIGNGQRQVKVGRYSSLDHARVARKAAERVLGYHKNHGRASVEGGAS